MNSEILLKEINNLKLEIEKDKNEFSNVPERFKSVAQLEIETKTNKLIEKENHLTELYELETTKRLQNIFHIAAHEEHAFHRFYDSIRVGKVLASQ